MGITKVKYHTISYREDFVKVKMAIKHEAGGINRLIRLGEPYGLMGNHKVQEFRVQFMPELKVKIEGPEKILKEFLDELEI